MGTVQKLSNGYKRRSSKKGSLTRAFLCGVIRLRILIRRIVFFLPALATSAAAFAKGGAVTRMGSPKMSWTSEGLSTNVYLLGTLKDDLFFALLGCQESSSTDWTAQEESIWIPLLRRGKSNKFGRVLYASNSNKLVLPWREATRATTEVEVFFFKEITIENAPQCENPSSMNQNAT